MGGVNDSMSRALHIILFIALSVVTSNLLAADRDQAIALLTAADALIATNPAKASEMCKKALAADDSCPLAHFKLAQCLEQINPPKPREAFKSYQNAAVLAKKESDAILERKAKAAAEKIGGGLMLISAQDDKLAGKLMPLADEALAQGQLETARQAYQAVLVVSPTQDKAKAGMEKAEKAIEARGDPIRAKVAAAKLQEVHYQYGVGNIDEAKKMASEITSAYANTPAGKDAAELIENDFGPPKPEQMAEAKKMFREQTKPKTGSGSTHSTGPAAPVVDVDGMEKTAQDEAKKVSKERLAATFSETYTKGKDFFKNAKPGSDGNQKNVASALEQFIHCEALYMRLDDEKLLNGDIQSKEKDASACRYSCMKMTILGH